MPSGFLQNGEFILIWNSFAMIDRMVFWTVLLINESVRIQTVLPKLGSQLPLTEQAHLTLGIFRRNYVSGCYCDLNLKLGHTASPAGSVFPATEGCVDLESHNEYTAVLNKASFKSHSDPNVLVSERHMCSDCKQSQDQNNHGVSLSLIFFWIF